MGSNSSNPNLSFAGNYTFSQFSTAIQESINDQDKIKVLAQTSQSNSQLDAAAGPLELGATSVGFKYFDEAKGQSNNQLGRYYETNSAHYFLNNTTSKGTNVPDSSISQVLSIRNVGNRFVR